MKNFTKTLIILLIALLQNQVAFSQPNLPKEKADSLWAVWEDESLPDTSRLKAIHDYAWDGYVFTKPDSAFYYAQLQYDFANSKGLKRHMAKALKTKGVSFYFRGEYTKSINYYTRSLKIQEEIGNKNGVANLLNNIGLIYTNQANYSKALIYQTQGLKIREEIEDKQGIAASLRNIGIIYLNQADSASKSSDSLLSDDYYAKTIKYFKKSLKIQKEIGDKKEVANILNNLGNICERQDDYSQSIGYYLKCLIIQKEIGNKKEIANTLNNLGNIYKKQGNYPKAIEYHTRRLKIEEELGNQQGIAFILDIIGSIYESQGNNPKALDYQARRLKIEEELGDQSGIASSLLSIGWIYKNLGNYTKALDYYTRGLKIREELGDQSGIASSLNSIGIVYGNQGKYTQSLDYKNRSLKIYEELGNQNGIAYILNNIGANYGEQGDYSKALDYYTRGLKITKELGDQNLMAAVLGNIGDNYNKQGNYSKAIYFSEKALTTAEEVGFPDWIKFASRSLFETTIFTGETSKSKKYLSSLYSLLQNQLRTNFFTLPEQEKQTFFTTMESDFGLYHDFTLHFQDKFDKLTDTSYNIALQNKGLTLKSSTAMRSAIQNSGDTTLINQYEDWLTLKKKIANTNTTDSTYKALTNHSNKMERELVKNSTVFSDFDKVKNLQWQDVQAGLKENEAAIEFVNFKSKIDTANPIIYAALIIKKENQHPEMVKLCNEADLKEILGVFQGNNLDFVNSVYGNQEKVQTALYEKVWKPMEESLEGIENIYLSPSGLLHKVAFHAIAKDQNTYLCDVYNLQQQSSTGKIALPDEVAFNKSKEFLMLGGVQYNTDTIANEIWSYLPGTLAETNNIKSYLQKKKFNITHLTGPNASEEKIKVQAPKSNILHVATHGFFFPDPEKVREEMEDNSVYYGDIAFRGNDIDPDKLQRSTRYADWTFVKNKNPLMRSGLALANANDVWQRPALAEGEDGVLTANEVSTLDLRKIDLVVLSACETGLGDIKGSEGVYGLQRAFKMAGAKYLIMSLWQVPDKETAEFMGLFYKHLVKSEDIRVAFSKTQKVMREKYDPYYWGAFVLIE